MARLVRHEATAPVKLDPNAPAGSPGAWPRDEAGNLKRLSICACGVSATFPFCDGAHRTCRDGEKPGVLYVYDIANRRVIREQPDPGHVP